MPLEAKSIILGKKQVLEQPFLSDKSIFLKWNSRYFSQWNLIRLFTFFEQIAYSVIILISSYNVLQFSFFMCAILFLCKIFVLWDIMYIPTREFMNVHFN